MNKQKKTTCTPRPIASTFQIVEAYKTVRTNLLFALAAGDNKVVVATSAEPGAGKSTTVANLAITVAQTGAKVLLIDADMRRPSQHKTFHLKKRNGLSLYLAGMLTMEEIIHPEVVAGVDLITSGSIPPNPSELLGSEKMTELLATVREQYDYVFIDTPPIGVVSDALVFGNNIAGILLICRQRMTNYEELSTAVKNVRAVDQTLLGVIITDMKQENRIYKRQNYGRYYKRYDYSYSTETTTTPEQ